MSVGLGGGMNVLCVSPCVIHVLLCMCCDCAFDVGVTACRMRHCMCGVCVIVCGACVTVCGV